MFNRRKTLAMLGATAVNASFGAANAATPDEWPPYRQALAIDGAGGLALGFYEPDDPQTAIELAAARASGLSAVITTLAPQGRFWMDDAAIERARNEAIKWNSIIERYPDRLVAIRSGADLKRARAENKLGIVYTFQGAEPLGEDVDRVTDYRDLGVRVIQLTHNRRNLVGDGSSEPGDAGLSSFGKEVVARLNAERIVVDLAHGSPRTMREGVEATTSPPLISHTGCRALADHPRNVDDATLRALAQKGGVAGIIFWPYLRVDTQPMAIDVVRHIEHAIKVCGEDHVGVGTDGFVGAIERTADYEVQNREWVADAVADGVFQRGRPADLYTFIPDLNVPNRFERLAALLAQRGHKEERIMKVLGGNFARVMMDVWG